MRRRAFIAGLGGAAAVWPVVARAQQPERMRLIGMLMPFAEGDPETQQRVAALRQGFAQLGWNEGRNLRIEHRWATTPDEDARRRFAKELVDLQPDLILTNDTNMTGRTHSRSSSCRLPIPWVAGSSRVFRAPAATPPGSPISRSRYRASGSSCSWSSRRAPSG
jgi:hypothetical protein